jgi:2-polyprenyl-6-methoxyphenol hydroxylase-like FAD-dependent oxidoreductase
MPTGGVAMTEHAVVIAGGGPTGLMLAGELAWAGVDVAIVEPRASPELISGSTPNTWVRGSFRRSGRSLRPPPC